MVKPADGSSAAPGAGTGDDAAIGPDGKPLLQYPLEYPIKVVHRTDAASPAHAAAADGASSGATRSRIDAVVRRHAPDLDASRITERASREANFVSVTYVIVARSRAQIVALAAELKATEGVVMVI